MDITFSCTKCGQHIVIHEDAAGQLVDCPKCGTPLEVPYKSQPAIKPAAPSPAIAPPPAQPAAETKQCPFCAETILKAAVVCKHCGRDLAPKTDGQTSTAARPRVEIQTNVKQGALIGGWVCFVVAALCLVAPIPTFFLWIPLAVAAFILSIVAMSQRRVAGGLALLLVTIIGVPGLWAYGTSNFLKEFSDALKTSTHESAPTVKPSAPTRAASQTEGRPASSIEPAIAATSGETRPSAQDAEQQVEAPRKAERQAAQTPGRIGESRAKIYTRYGEPYSTTDDGYAVFFKGGFVIAVYFFHEKADAITFNKEETDVLGHPKKMSDNEIQTLLKSCGGDKEWKKLSSISTGRRWQTEDGALFGYYKTIDNRMGIATKENVERTKAEKKSEEDKKLDGF